MFYAHFVLSKKGPLARIWLAAHWDKKVTKAHVYETDIVSSVAAILEPKLKMALRTSGHLLLGVVRIYSRKAKYLLADCNEAYLKFMIAFRPGLVDLPEENREAALAAITLPDTLNVDFDMHLLDADFDMAPATGFFELDPSFSLPGDAQQARMDNITLLDSTAVARPLRRAHDEDDFGDASYFSAELPARSEIELPRANESAHQDSAVHRDSLVLHSERREPASTKRKEPDVHSLLLDASDADFGDAAAMLGIAARPPTQLQQSRVSVAVDEFGDEQFGGFIAEELGASNTADILFGDPHAANEQRESLALDEPENEQQNALHDETESAAQNLNAIISGAQPTRSTAVHVLNASRTLDEPSQDAFVLDTHPTMQIVARSSGPRSVASSAPTNQTRSTALTGTKRKRRLIIDEQKSIPSDAMKAQMQVTSDIVTTLELAPPTKRLMFWKESGTADRMLAQPAAPSRSTVSSKSLERAFGRRLIVSRWSNWSEEPHKRSLDDLDESAILEKRAREDANVDVIELADASQVQIEHVQHDSMNGAAFDAHDDLFAIVDNAHLADSFEQSDKNAPSPAPSPSPPPRSSQHEPDTSRYAPQVHDEAMERITINAVAGEGLEAHEQAFLGKKVLAFYAELKHMAAVPRSSRRADAPISFNETCRHASRKQAANKFLALLFLLKQNCVSVEQRASYTDINVRLLGPKEDDRRDNTPHSPTGNEKALKQHVHTNARNHTRTYATCASPTSAPNALGINMQRNSSLAIQ